MKPITSGSPRARIWIIGEAPGADEIHIGAPFVGASGQLLTSMLLEAGIDRSSCYITNLCHERPPNNDIENFFTKKSTAVRDGSGATFIAGRYALSPIVEGREHLLRELATYKPHFIVALGNTALWGLSGIWGIGKWRGSILNAPVACRDVDGHEQEHYIKFIPTIHPAAVLREWSLRHIVVQDLRRAKRESLFPEIRYPEWKFHVRPTYHDARVWLLQAMRATYLSVDIETYAGLITCVGIATSTTNAICIPFFTRHGATPGNYWTSDQEYDLVLLLRQLLTRTDATIIFQNGAYDLQYFAHHWGYLPRISHDTMLMQHVAFPGLRKGLDFLSSLYCEYHRYWKDDGKNWDLSGNEDQHWRYNCEDVVRTLECYHALERIIPQMGLTEQYQFQMTRLFPIIVRMMLRGVRIDFQRRAEIRRDLEAFIIECETWLKTVLGHPLNVNSAPAMKTLFYDDLQLPIQLNRKTKRPSLDDDAMEKLERRHPLLRPLFMRIRGIRSARNLLSNIVGAPVAPDGRMRCTYNLAGTETFRLSSSEDAFGFGTNLQNVTKGTEE